MRSTPITALALGACMLFSCAAPAPAPEEQVPFEEFRGDAETTREAIAGWVAKGKEALPELAKGLEDDSARVRRACRTAMAKITGQWGWDEGLMWRPSWEAAKEEAKETGRPIMLLHLFGRFDEEFC